MEGVLARSFCELNPFFFLNNKGILYLKCLKALYGYSNAARLFYNELDHSLTEKMNFIRNKYDPCVYNQGSENGEITTNKTHVDDLKV